MTDTPAERGRPLTYTQEVADKIIAELKTGRSLRSVCRDEGMPPESTVRGWVVDDHEGFAAQYTRARDIGLDARADEIMEIVRNAKDAPIDRLKFDAERWYLSKLAPKRYGDKIAHVGGDPATDNPIQTKGTLDVTGLREDQLRALASIKTG